MVCCILADVMRFWLVLILIGLVAVGLKTYRWLDFASYGSETAQHYFEVSKLYEGDLPQGPLTSKSWLRLSAFPYYVFYPIWFVLQFHPLALAGVWTAVSVGTVVLAGYLAQKWWGSWAGAYAGVFTLITWPLWSVDRSTGFFAFVIPLSLWLIYELQKKKTRWWLVGLIASLCFTLHASALFYVPALVVVIGTRWWTKSLGSFSMSKLLLAVLLPQLPLVIADAQSGFVALKNLTLWIPYKIINFASGQTLGLERTEVADVTGESILRFISSSVLPPDLSLPLTVVVSAGLVMALGWRAYSLSQEKSFHSAEWLLIIFLVTGLIALTIHKNPPSHYFVPILLFVPLLLARWLALMKNRVLIFIFLGIISLVNWHYFVSVKFANMPLSPYFYGHQLAVAQAIAQSSTQPYHLVRIGDFDTYPNQFKENYLYLLRWLGNPATPDNQIAQSASIILEKAERTAELLEKFPTARQSAQLGSASIWLAPNLSN